LVTIPVALILEEGRFELTLEFWFGLFWAVCGLSIGAIFLLVCLIRVERGDFTPEKHVGFEAAIWYWHFVDVVWLFLFAAIYIWGA
ncbi:cytochrome c oxidase subunit 3, partial [Yoonia sp.]|uniref:cytochrome c oxidase subunit 3 n=1 Tax=Yoonia sp. TaxID=2212373 RepID=UPI003A4E52E3